MPLTWSRASSRPPNGTHRAGLKQRIYALNLFIDDVYHEQDPQGRRRPGRSSLGATLSRGVCRLNPPRGIWCHITGTDLVRDKDGPFYVLEDNLRCPSGVSYVLENRRDEAMFPQLFEAFRIRRSTTMPGASATCSSRCAPPSQTPRWWC